MAVVEEAVTQTGLQPRTKPSGPAPGVVPAQRTAAPAPAERVVVDHVRAHSMRCYWDVAECRWVCRRDA